MSILSNIFTSLILGNNSSKNEKESVINLYRYVRFFDPITGNIDSNSGMTFKVILDYNVGTISYRAVICQNDNFSRKHGRDIVDSSNRPMFTIPMNYNEITGTYEIAPEKGTMGMILDHIYRVDIKHTHENKMYQRFIFKMHRLGFRIC